jgi:ribonuclease-3
MINIKVVDFQIKLKIKFNDIELLKLCLTHKSYDAFKNNEKLEFLGDRVLGLILSKTLLKYYPQEKEGIIDKKFANLVNKKTCAQIANEINIGKFMLLGDSYKRSTKINDKIVSDGLEALIGAIFLDKGLNEAENFILTYWKIYLDKSGFTHIDAKTQLQEYSLKKYKELPKYKLYKETGPRHKPTFKVEVNIPNSKKFSANGGTKKDAQQNAAKKLLIDLNI